MRRREKKQNYGKVSESEKEKEGIDWNEMKEERNRET